LCIVQSELTDGKFLINMMNHVMTNGLRTEVHNNVTITAVRIECRSGTSVIRETACIYMFHRYSCDMSPAFVTSRRGSETSK
jgi:hypothetical protein